MLFLVCVTKKSSLRQLGAILKPTIGLIKILAATSGCHTFDKEQDSPPIADAARVQTKAAVEAPISEQAPSRATAEDMALFVPYIGRFRSESYNDGNEGRFYFVIDYRWYDTRKRIVAYTLEQIFLDKQESRAVGDGFYCYDSLNQKIGVFGAFPDGRTGSDTMGRFDRNNHSRTVWIVGTAPDRPPVEVRDHFEIIDGNSWRNITRIRPKGSKEPWREISNDVYTRISPAPTLNE